MLRKQHLILSISILSYSLNSLDIFISLILIWSGFVYAAILFSRINRGSIGVTFRWLIGITTVEQSELCKVELFIFSASFDEV